LFVSLHANPVGSYSEKLGESTGKRHAGQLNYYNTIWDYSSIWDWVRGEVLSRR